MPTTAPTEARRLASPPLSPPALGPTRGFGLLRRWRELHRQGGGTLAYYLCRRLLLRGRLGAVADLQIHQIVEVPPGRLELPARLARGLRVRELGGNDDDLAALDRLRPARGEAYVRRFAEAHRALGAFLDQRLVAFVWLCRGPALIPAHFGCLWQLSASMAWIYDLYSDPEVLGAIPHLYAHLRRHPPGAGCLQLVGQTDYDNLRSRRAHRRLGYRTRAQLWSLRLGRWRWYFTRAESDGRWRRHRRQAVIPLELLAANSDPHPHPITAASIPAPPPPRPGLRLQCHCGLDMSLAEESAEPFTCACGRRLGGWRDGVAVAGPEIGYWGELPQATMAAVLERGAAQGWRGAVEDLVPESLRSYIASRGRADFQDVLPVPDGSLVLDLGAGWGGVAATLARRHRVVALEGVAERARFIALRKRQDRLDQLTVVQGDVLRAPLAPHQFDLIVVNGVLEWVALQNLSASPEAVQLIFLHRLRQLLAPGGRIYLAIENRIGWSELRGTPDHSGLPYTSLLPRPLARAVCARSRRFRSQFNFGYRTYTYTHRGYAALFAQVGLRIRNTWICPAGYNDPYKMIPPHRAAIRFAAERGAPPALRAGHGGWRQLARRWGAQAWIWRWFGSDFAFLVEPAPAPQPAARAPVPPCMS